MIVLNSNKYLDSDKVVLTELIKHLFSDIALDFKKELLRIEITLMSDLELLEINQQYLKHDTFTDIITFDLSDSQEAIEGDIYISLDRVKDNAVNYHVDAVYELMRVIIHGCLHLCGLNDKSNEEKNLMRNTEKKYLEIVSRETLNRIIIR